MLSISLSLWVIRGWNLLLADMGSLWSAHFSHLLTNVQRRPPPPERCDSQEDRSSSFATPHSQRSKTSFFFFPSPRCTLQRKRSPLTKACHPTVTNVKQHGRWPPKDKDIQPNWDLGAWGGWKRVYIIMAIMFLDWDGRSKHAVFHQVAHKWELWSCCIFLLDKMTVIEKVVENIVFPFELNKSGFLFMLSFALFKTSSINNFLGRYGTVGTPATLNRHTFPSFQKALRHLFQENRCPTTAWCHTVALEIKDTSQECVHGNILGWRRNKYSPIMNVSQLSVWVRGQAWHITHKHMLFYE